MASVEQSDTGSTLVQRNKRRGAALSCAECRRLKLKCSRVFPCSNCVKKGCGPICPEGSLTTGKGNRFVLANTEALHDKISQLSTRVRQLEDALEQSHSLTSPHPHPLLSEELLQIKRPLERERIDLPSSPNETSDAADSINAVGSLSISESGRSTFFGQAANAWYLLKNEEGSDEENTVSPVSFNSPIPSDVPWLSYAFPFAPSVDKTAEDLRGSLISLLPAAAVTRHLTNIYYRHAAWMYTPITETEFNDFIFRPIYDPDGSYQEPISSHCLAVLYMVLALGTLLDLDRPPHSQEALQFYQLGRAALSIDSVLEEQTVTGIQALLLMCHYMFLDDIEGPRWAAMGVVVKLAQSVGLHRDSGKWKLAEQEAHRRRCLLWEIVVYDSWQSLTYGRPPSFSMAHIDSKLPHSTTKNAAGDIEMSFAAWKHGFALNCLSIVHDQAFGARPPSYKIIQELDKKVRLYYVPPSLQVPGFGGAKLTAEREQPSVELVMQRHIVFAIKEISLFYMHRGFFARALEDSPQDPMGSKYAASVLAAYTGACSFVGLVESLHKQHPALTERMWFLFTHVFSCSVVLGSIAVKVQMAIAPSALSHLESAYNLFSRVTESRRTTKILPILHKLRERAHSTMAMAHSPSPDIASRLSKGSMYVTVKNEEDEFAPLGGGTRLVSRKTSSTPSTPSNPRSPSSPPSQSASPSNIPEERSQPESVLSAMPVVSPSDWQPYSPDFQNIASPYSLPRVQAENSIMYREHSSFDSLRASQSMPMIGNGMSAEAPVGYYTYQQQAPYEPNTYPSYNMNSLPTNGGDFAIPISDLQASWHNFVSQYK